MGCNECKHPIYFDKDSSGFVQGLWGGEFIGIYLGYLNPNP